MNAMPFKLTRIHLPGSYMLSVTLLPACNRLYTLLILTLFAFMILSGGTTRGSWLCPLP